MDPTNNNAPRMPHLVANVAAPSGLSVFWKLSVTFHDRHGNPHRDFDTGDPNDSNTNAFISQDVVTIPFATNSGDNPTNGWVQITNGSNWNIFQDPDWTNATNQGFFGGDAMLSLKILDSNGNTIAAQQDYNFRIAGENPSATNCQAYIVGDYGGPNPPSRNAANLNAWQGFWFADAIAREETSSEGSSGYYNHFLTSGGKKTANPGKVGCPNWNDDGTDGSRDSNGITGRWTGTGGYGLFQHTYEAANTTGETGDTNYIMPRNWIWNWQANADNIIGKLNHKYTAAQKTYNGLVATYPTYPDIPNHLNFSGLESLMITYYNGGGGKTKRITLPGYGTRLTCWTTNSSGRWTFLPNTTNYVDNVNLCIGK